jgi:hypothetical protein
MSKIVFHPDIHGDIRFFKRTQDLNQMSMDGKIYLMTESLDYNRDIDLNNHKVVGLEDIAVHFNYCILCTAYQTSLVHFNLLYEGGKHSKVCFSSFLCAVFSNPLLKKITENYATTDWYSDFCFFLNDFNENNVTMETVVKHIQKRGKARGGLPKNIPFSFIRDSCEEFLRKTFVDIPIEDIIIIKTLLEREKTMYHNLQHFIQRTKDLKEKKEIHILVGAGHLMPYLSDKQLSILNVDPFFISYHTDTVLKKYPNKRLLDYMKDENYEIQISV